MKLTVYRRWLDMESTIGELYINGKPYCYTLEDAVREIEGKPVNEWKISGKTAIPYGAYDVELTFSNRFQKLMPQVMDVPGFDGIRIHPGNYAGKETFYKKVPIDTLKDVLYSDEYVEVLDD